MADYDNTDRGVLFKNDKEGNAQRPDYKGNINVGGTEFWLSAWIKDGAKGKFMSLSVQPKEQQQPQQQRQPAPAANLADLDSDSIPF